MEQGGSGRVLINEIRVEMRADALAIALYQGWLQVGYATVYTMAPVFSLVLDRDVSEELAMVYPELYKELTKVSCVEWAGRRDVWLSKADCSRAGV